MSNKGFSYIISLFVSPKLIISYLSSIRGSAIKAIQERIIVEGVSSIMCLKGTKFPRIKEAGIIVKRSFAFKVAFLASNIVILAFIVTSLLLIPRRFLTKCYGSALARAALVPIGLGLASLGYLSMQCFMFPTSFLP
jgi:hypothetical protein